MNGSIYRRSLITRAASLLLKADLQMTKRFWTFNACKEFLGENISETNLDGRCREKHTTRATQRDESGQTCTSGYTEGTPRRWSNLASVKLRCGGVSLKIHLAFQPHLIVWESRNESSPDCLNCVIGLFPESKQHRQLQPNRHIQINIYH